MANLWSKIWSYRRSSGRWLPAPVFQRLAKFRLLLDLLGQLQAHKNDLPHHLLLVNPRLQNLGL